MKILIDECLPHQVRSCLTGHEAHTVTFAGFGGYENGDLLKVADLNYDLFVTSDKNLRYQQNLAGRRLAIILLSTNDRYDLLKNCELILATVNRIKAADFVELNL